MDITILIIVIIILIPLIYQIYFWINSEILTDEEINELSNAKRFWDISLYFSFVKTQFEVNKKFKSTLNKYGQFYNCNETISVFPGIASALLKNKKHEWVIFAFVKKKNVFSFYTNKGDDNQSVAPNFHAEQITKLAKDKGVDTVLQFHNHPNSILSASSQDLRSAKYFGKIFTSKNINYASFVCGAGLFYQYSWWMAESFYNLKKYVDIIQKENGKSRSNNFALRKELKSKKAFKDFRLNNNSSHNFLINNISKDFGVLTNQKYNKMEGGMDYLQKVLKLFNENLIEYPKDGYLEIEKMDNMGDNKNETWNKYYYKFSQKEVDLFENMEMIDHSKENKTFIFNTKTFSINDVEYLVSFFYRIFGDDMMGVGKFCDEDYNQIVNDKFWFGRLWTNYKVYKCSVMINIFDDNSKLSLSVKW